MALELGAACCSVFLRKLEPLAIPSDDPIELSVALELDAIIGSVLPLVMLVDDPVVGSLDIILLALLIELIELTTESLGGCGGTFTTGDVDVADSDIGVGNDPNPGAVFSDTLLPTLAGDILLAGLIPLLVTAFSNWAVN